MKTVVYFAGTNAELKTKTELVTNLIDMIEEKNFIQRRNKNDT